MFSDTHKPTTARQVIGAQYSTMALSSWLRSWNTPQRQFRAAMLSGPTGIGKSLLAELIYAEAGMKNVLHVDSSRKRTKKALAEVEEAFMSRKIDAYLTGKMQRSKPGGLIIDDLDAMVTGSADRGGVPQIISFIKTTKIPVVCICNDATHRSLKTLVAQCMHVRMQRPSVEGVAQMLLEVSRSENIRIDASRARDIAIRSGCDVRQALCDLQFSVGSRTVTLRQEHTVLNLDRPTNAFDTASMLFGCRPKDSARVGTCLYECDSMLGPMLVSENYPKTTSDMCVLADVAAAISEGDALEGVVRRKRGWGSIPNDVLGLMTCSIPCAIARSKLDGRVDFPSLLGRSSTFSKNRRMSIDLAGRMGRKRAIRTSRQELSTEISPALHRIVIVPLILAQKTDKTIACQTAASRLRNMGMIREDWDTLQDLGAFSSKTGPMLPATRTALTKAFEGKKPRKLTSSKTTRARMGKDATAPPPPPPGQSDDDEDDDDEPGDDEERREKRETW
jgi:replication factor C subunit 1